MKKKLDPDLTVTLLEFVIPNCGRQVLTALLNCSSLTETCAEVFPIESKKRFFRASSTVPTLTQSFRQTILQISKTKRPQCHLYIDGSHKIPFFDNFQLGARVKTYHVLPVSMNLDSASLHLHLPGQKGCGELVLG